MRRFNISVFISSLLIVIGIVPQLGFAHTGDRLPPSPCSCAADFDVTPITAIPVEAERHLLLKFPEKVQGMLEIHFIPEQGNATPPPIHVQADHIRSTIMDVNANPHDVNIDLVKEKCDLSPGDYIIKVVAKDMDGKEFRGCFTKK